MENRGQSWKSVDHHSKALEKAQTYLKRCPFDKNALRQHRTAFQNESKCRQEKERARHELEQFDEDSNGKIRSVNKYVKGVKALMTESVQLKHAMREFVKSKKRGATEQSATEAELQFSFLSKTILMSMYLQKTV